MNGALAVRDGIDGVSRRQQVQGGRLAAASELLQHAFLGLTLASTTQMPAIIWVRRTIVAIHRRMGALFRRIVASSRIVQQLF